MSVTQKDVDHVARLAHLSFNDGEKQRLTAELNTILSYMDQLNGLDTENVEPLSHVIELENVFRADVRTPGLSTDDALQNAPGRVDDFFTVPKVIADR
ncbi:MAG: Asp-tRNA(Asn)/Glu-tRNA(Gln) amidotransferase subunit GatC [Ignavibacteriae bacterium]|nr:Asp-tRNA(Asn)/Glu-tRNA(Gln) amidotransferase subunit GatC [Ignavibacteriota bacterium]